MPPPGWFKGIVAPRSVIGLGVFGRRSEWIPTHSSVPATSTTTGHIHREMRILGHDHHLVLPERGLISCWVEHGYLALILSGRKLTEGNAKGEGHGLQPVVQCLRHLHGPRFKGLGFPAVETHKRDKGLHAGRPLLIGLQVYIHVLVLAEYPGDAGNQFLSILNQRVYRFLFTPVFVFLCVVESIFEIYSLTAQHHGADGDVRELLVQIWDDEGGLISADSARLIVAGKKFDLVFSRQKREAGVVFDRSSRQLGGGRVRELDVDVVADIGHRGAADQVFNFADEVDQGMLGAATLGQGELAAGNLDNDRHEIFRPVELEVIDLHRDGELGDGILEHERVFELTLFIDGVEVAELLIRVVALAVIEVRAYVLRERDFHPAEMSIPGRVRGVVANDVVIGDGLLRLNDTAGQVVGIEEGFAAGVAGEGEKSVLRLLEVGGRGLGGGAGVHAGIALRALGSIAQWSLCDQTAGVDGPERDTRSNSRVDGSVQLCLVINAVEAQAAGEVDERFLFVQLAQHLGRGLQGGELAIGVEDVELAVVLPECGAGVGAAGVVDGLGRSLALPNDKGFKNAEQLVAIGGKVLQDVDRTTLVAQNGYQVDRGQLRADELLGSRER